MVLGRLFHYTFDALLLSSLAAGIKRSTGLAPDTARIEDATARGLVEKYLGVGDFVFDTSVAAAGASKYFVRQWAQTQTMGGASSSSTGAGGFGARDAGRDGRL